MSFFYIFKYLRYWKTKLKMNIVYSPVRTLTHYQIETVPTNQSNLKQISNQIFSAPPWLRGEVRFRHALGVNKDETTRVCQLSIRTCSSSIRIRQPSIRTCPTSIRICQISRTWIRICKNWIDFSLIDPTFKVYMSDSQ